MIVARIVRCFTTTAATLIVALCSMLRAQDLEPRAYSNSPTGLNFAIVGYGYAKGSILTDPSLPLDNVSNESHVALFAYATTLNVLGKSAKVTSSSHTYGSQRMGSPSACRASGTSRASPTRRFVSR